MRFEHLVAHGLSRRLIAAWEKAHGETLLPLQERAVVETSLLRGGNLVVFAPTSSGKTLLAELAAMARVEKGQKAVFLTPTKALAEEQFAQLRHKYLPLGTRVVIATRERTRFDGDILDGHFDIAIMVYEKFKALLTVSPQMLSNIGVVVVDELQLLGDLERGALVDLLMAKLLSSPHPVQIVALSAVLGESARIASWLGGDFLISRDRPVELREGVLRLNDGVFQYREATSGDEGEEQLLPAETRGQPDASDFHLETIHNLARTLVAAGEQLLIFVPTRHLSRQWAWHFSHDDDFPTPPNTATARQELMNSLALHEESHSREILAQCCARGVGIHNADVPAELRRLVEDAFRSGGLRVLVATSTLAQGVNLLCRNVISVPVMVGSDVWTGAPAFVPLTRRRFRNQGGRAGRVSGTDIFGRSIVIAEDESEADQLLRDLVRGDPEPLEEPIRAADMEKLVLDLLACGMAGTRDDLVKILMRTYTAHVSWPAQAQQPARMIEDALGRLAQSGLVSVQGNDAPAPTALGEAAAAFGIEPVTAQFFAQWISVRLSEQDAFPPPSPFEILALCAFSRDGEMFPMPLTGPEKREHHYAHELAARGDIRLDELPPPLHGLLTVYGGIGEKGQMALKKAFIAELWISAAPTADVEEGHRTFAGTISNLSAHLSWLAQALAACAAAMGMTNDVTKEISQLAARLPDGVLSQGLPLARLEVSGLTRSFIADLIRSGFEAPSDVGNSTVDELAKIMPPSLARRLHAAALDDQKRRNERRKEPGMWGWFAHRREQVGEEVPPASRAAENPEEYNPPGCSKDSKEILILSPMSPGQVTFHGTSVLLPPKTFALLLLLALTPGRVVSYSKIDETLWPEEKVEPQQVLAHKRSLIRALEKASGVSTSDLIRVVKGHGLMLNLPSSGVMLETD